MNVRGLALAALASAASPTPVPAAQEGLARVATLQLPRELTARDAALGDLDGDGQLDVVVSASRERVPFARALQVYLGKSGAGAPASSIDLTPDVVAWAIGDVHPAPGDEIVLFSAAGAFAWRALASAEQRLSRLVAAPFLWQVPDPEQAFLWDSGVRDLDGDGRDDLVLPVPGGCAFAVQRRTREDEDFGWQSLVFVPSDETSAGAWLSSADGEPTWRGRRSQRELSFSVRLGGARSEAEDDEPATLLELVETSPAPQLVDWDADGDLDLLAQTERRLHVWIQEPRGRYERVPSFSWPLPVPADRERRLDPSYGALALDLTADGRCDAAIFASDKRASDVRAQALLFVQGAGRGEGGQSAVEPLFGARGRPQDVLVFAGFVSDADFAPVDRDPYPELVAITVRLDLIDQVRSASTETIDADLSVYRNRRGSFSKRPDLTWRYSVPLRDFIPTVRFFADVTGDGVSELLARDAPARVRLHRVAAKGEGWSVVERPIWELAIQDSATLRVAGGRGRAVPDLLVVEKTQVLHVRFP